VLRAGCPGFDARYLERFHGDEASPRAAARSRDHARARLPAREAALLEMFVGVGERYEGELAPEEINPTRVVASRSRVSEPGGEDVARAAERGPGASQAPARRVQLPVVNS
jgi:hypothetical protein